MSEQEQAAGVPADLSRFLAAAADWLGVARLRWVPAAPEMAAPADPDEARAREWLAAGADPAGAAWTAADGRIDAVVAGPGVLLAQRSGRRPRPPGQADMLATVAGLTAAWLAAPAPAAPFDDLEANARARLAAALGPRGSAFVVGLDRLAVVNEVFGRAAGDTILDGTLRRLADWAGGPDRVARLSGTRFGIVRPDLDDAEAGGRAAEQLRDALAEPVVVDGLGISRSVSVGLSTDPAASAAERVTRAARASLIARAFGGDAVTVYEDAGMDERLGRLQLELELDHALRSGQLRLYYQPEFDLRTGELLAVEALLRWQHPRLGLVRADAFVEGTERSRTFGAVQSWVFEEACRQLAAWQALPAGRRLGVRVNVSAWQVARSAILDDLLGAIDRHGLAPENICVELTERRMPRRAARVAEALKTVVDAGVSIAIDDFGTGEGTVSQLISLPVDTIKIDQSFVVAMRTDPRAEAVVAQLVALADALDLETVAEGVDGADTAARLVELGCLRGQGNSLGEAMPASDVEPFLRR